MTLCPLFDPKHLKKPPLYNLDNLAECGLDPSNLSNGNFIANQSSECQDPSTFWDMISLKLNDFGLKKILVKHSNGDFYALEIDQVNWETFRIGDFSTCLTLSLPKQSDDVRSIRIVHAPDMNLKLFVHEKYQNFPFVFGASLEVAEAFSTEQKGLDARVSFVFINSFPTSEINCVSDDDKTYSFSKCLIQTMDKVIRFLIKDYI